MFTTKERQIAPEGLIKMFLEREENAKRLETKTGKDKIKDQAFQKYQKEITKFLQIYFAEITELIIILSDKILDGKGDEEETNLKPSQESSEVTGDKKPEKAECEDENLVVKRNPSGENLNKFLE